MAKRDEAAPVKAGIYLRISKDFTGEALGVARQLEDCSGLAQQLGWDVVETYTDNDISATSGKTRPGYRRMLADIDAGHVAAIIAWHPDRLYRKAVDLGEIVDVCKRNNTQIATCRAGTVDLTTPTGRLVAGLLAQVATYEGEAKADRWRRSWRQGREAGKVARTGSRLFGYTRDSVIIPAEHAITLRMVDDILSGVSVADVTRWLDAEGILTTRGSVWRSSTIRQYLKNPRLAGHSTLGGDIVAEGDWEPLLDRETWEQIRGLIEARAGQPYGPRVALLNGLIHCGRCDAPLITGASRAIRIYRCPPGRPDRVGCGKTAGRADSIEDVVESYAQVALDDPRTRERLNRLRGTPSQHQSELSDLTLRLGELEQQLDEPGVPVATLLRAIERTRERQAKILGEMTAQPLVVLPVEGPLPWPDDLRRRRALVDLVVAKVVLAPSGVATNTFKPERVQVTPR